MSDRQPMSDSRLGRLRAYLGRIRRLGEGVSPGELYGYVVDLLGEVGRLRIMLAARGVDPDAEYTPGAGRFVYRDPATGEIKPSSP